MAEQKPAPISARSGTELLRLARADREAALRELRTLSHELQALACRELRPRVRNEFLMLLDQPEKVVPLLPEAELVHTIKAGGVNDAAWLLELATPDQRVACFDLDCWDADTPDLPALREWTDALIEAGRDTLGKAMQEIGLELWILLLRADAEVVIVGREDEPPTGYYTLDGVVYFGVQEDASLHRITELAHAAWERDQPLYWRLVYGTLFELPSNCEEDALRWRTNRLQDLGFPDREQALRVYRPLAVDQVNEWRLAGESQALVSSFDLPVQMRGTLIAEALAELPVARAGDLLGYLLAVANSIAVADRLPLSDPESIPRALSKAVTGIDAGLREVARARNESPARVLDSVVPLDLFRVGVTGDPRLR